MLTPGRATPIVGFMKRTLLLVVALTAACGTSHAGQVATTPGRPPAAPVAVPVVPPTTTSTTTTVAPVVTTTAAPPPVVTAAPVVPVVAVADPGPKPVVHDPGPNVTVPVPAGFVQPPDPPVQVLVEQHADGQSTWRCTDGLGYEYIFGGLEPPIPACVEIP